MLKIETIICKEPVPNIYHSGIIGGDNENFIVGRQYELYTDYNTLRIKTGPNTFYGFSEDLIKKHFMNIKDIRKEKLEKLNENTNNT